MSSPPPNALADSTATVQCRPCRQTYQVTGMANPRQCPTCGGPTLSAAQTQGFRAATDASLRQVRSQCLHMLRVLTFGMIGVQILTYALSDRQIAEFVNHVVTIFSTIAAFATEFWAATGKRIWMIIASVCVQIAALVIFYVIMGLAAWVGLDGRVGFLIGVLPLAGSLKVWHNFHAHTQLQKAIQKRPAGL